MSILDGMESLGLGHLSNSNVYEEKDSSPQAKKENDTTGQEKQELKEEDYLYLKDYECPVCGNKFKSSVVKTGKARLTGQDKDLRPIHKGVDSMKYDVVHCNKCGYAVLAKYFGPLAKPHKELLKTNIADHYKPMEPVGTVIKYEEALIRYKLALVNAVCRQGKNSEKALICLKTAWLLRGMAEHQDEIVNSEEYTEEKLLALEEEYLKEAMEGFIKARQSEAPPIAGMTEITLDYLLSVLCIRFENFEDAVKLLQGILASSKASGTQKDKARDLILELKAAIKKKQA